MCPKSKPSIIRAPPTEHGHNDTVLLHALPTHSACYHQQISCSFFFCHYTTIKIHGSRKRPERVEVKPGLLVDAGARRTCYSDQRQARFFNGIPDTAASTSVPRFLRPCDVLLPLHPQSHHACPEKFESHSHLYAGQHYYLQP